MIVSVESWWNETNAERKPNLRAPFHHEPHIDLPEIEICLSLLSLRTFRISFVPLCLGGKPRAKHCAKWVVFLNSGR